MGRQLPESQSQILIYQTEKGRSKLHNINLEFLRNIYNFFDTECILKSQVFL